MSDLPEPPMAVADWEDFRRGIALFNGGQFWHAHEAWEAVWRRQRAHPSHMFFKGLIQLAAAHHQRDHGRHEGMLIHFERARAKLAPFAPRFLGVDVQSVLAETNPAARRESGAALTIQFSAPPSAFRHEQM